MLDPRIFFAIAIVGWLCAAVGLYRVLDDADVLGHGIAERTTPAFQIQARQRMLKAFLAPKHRIDRILLIGGAVVFVGVVMGMIVTASLLPLCSQGGVPPWCQADRY
jgi:hypothetical protein